MSLQLRPLVILLVSLTLITGVAYPFALFWTAQLIFPHQANGALVERSDTGASNARVGSELIGQMFTDSKYFWGRLSATTPMAFNAASSSGSNLGPTNGRLGEAIATRVLALRAADPGNTQPIPSDLVMASGSGLDPDISPASAYYQISRVARVRGLSASRLAALVSASIEGRQFGVLGEPRVNVLHLNLALDQLAPAARSARRGER